MNKFNFTKLNDKTQTTSTTLMIDPHNYTHLYINNTLSVYLKNRMLEQLLTLLLFFLESLTCKKLLYHDKNTHACNKLHIFPNY